MQGRILLVDDDPGLRMTLSDRLRSESYEVDTAADGNTGYSKAAEADFDVVILDLMLPGKSGLDVCRDLRRCGVTTPILMLSALGETTDKVVGLKLGADDYLPKPFEVSELLARIEALRRRSSHASAGPSVIHRFGSITVHFLRTEVVKDGAVIPVSAKEFQLLRYFIEHRGETLSRKQLLREVWGYDPDTSSGTVAVHVRWLRQKLEDDPKHPQWIITLHGLGYKFAG